MGNRHTDNLIHHHHHLEELDSSTDMDLDPADRSHHLLLVVEDPVQVLARVVVAVQLVGSNTEDITGSRVIQCRPLHCVRPCNLQCPRQFHHTRSSSINISCHRDITITAVVQEQDQEDNQRH